MDTIRNNKKRQIRHFVLLICIGVFLTQYGCYAGGPASGDDVQNNSTRGSANQDVETYLNYNGELYTDRYSKDIFLTHRWISSETFDLSDTAYLVYASAPKEKDFSVKIRVCSDDPVHNFIMEQGSLLTEERLYKKVSLTIPDYMDESAKIRAIYFVKNHEYSNPDSIIAVKEVQAVTTWMQFIRSAILRPDESQIFPVADKDDIRYTCNIEFEGINGWLTVGFVQRGNNTEWGLYVYDAERRGKVKGFTVQSIPNDLQSIF